MSKKNLLGYWKYSSLALPNIGAVSHMWLRSTENVAKYISDQITEYYLGENPLLKEYGFLNPIHLSRKVSGYLVRT